MRFLLHALIEICCSITLLTTSLVFVGAIIGHSEIGRWTSDDPGMAISTAGCLSLLAIAILVLKRHTCGG